MDQILTTLEIGLRVLTAISVHDKPDPSDVERLRELAPDWADRPADELACEVVQRVIKQRRRAAPMSARRW